jgi:hypothetical protein
MRGIVELASHRELFSRKKPAKAMKPALNFSNLLASEQFIMICEKENIQGDD